MSEPTDTRARAVAITAQIKEQCRGTDSEGREVVEFDDELSVEIIAAALSSIRAEGKAEGCTETWKAAADAIRNGFIEGQYERNAILISYVESFSKRAQ